MTCVHNSFNQVLSISSYIWHTGQMFILQNEFLHPALIGLTGHNTVQIITIIDIKRCILNDTTLIIKNISSFEIACVEKFSCLFNTLGTH